MRRDVLVVGLGPFGFESAVLQGEADVGWDRNALRFGKFELLNAKVRMGRPPGCPYTIVQERSSSSAAKREGRCRFFILEVLSQEFFAPMSYETRIDQMVGKHVTDFQTEISAAKKLQKIKAASLLWYGYAAGVYRRRASARPPRVSRRLVHPVGKMSNGVPWLLSLNLEDQYALGLYNPVRP